MFAVIRLLFSAIGTIGGTILGFFVGGGVLGASKMIKWIVIIAFLLFAAKKIKVI